MTAEVEWPLLVLAGIGAGVSGYVAGMASLVSYPALLAAGLPPVSANVTQTISLIFSTLGSVSASRPELAGQLPRLRRLAAVGLLGGLTGSALLLLTPPGAFVRIVPWLVAFGSIAILLPRGPGTSSAWWHGGFVVPGGVFLVAVYGGYFGAAAGVLMLALLLVSTGDTLPRANAAKNFVLGVANAGAALIFSFFGPVHWGAAVPLAAGLFIGGRLGPAVVRRAPTALLRLLIAAAGLGLALHLGLHPDT